MLIAQPIKSNKNHFQNPTIIKLWNKHHIQNKITNSECRTFWGIGLNQPYEQTQRQLEKTWTGSAGSKTTNAYTKSQLEAVNDFVMYCKPK